MYLETIFPARIYPAILRALPPAELYTPLNPRKWARADGTSTRDQFYMTPESIAKLPKESGELWNSFVSAATDGTLTGLRNTLMVLFQQMSPRTYTARERPRQERAGSQSRASLPEQGRRASTRAKEHASTWCARKAHHACEMLGAEPVEVIVVPVHVNAAHDGTAPFLVTHDVGGCEERHVLPPLREIGQQGVDVIELVADLDHGATTEVAALAVLDGLGQAP